MERMEILPEGRFKPAQEAAQRHRLSRRAPLAELPRR